MIGMLAVFGSVLATIPPHYDVGHGGENDDCARAAKVRIAAGANMTNPNEPIPYAKADLRMGWLRRHALNAGTRMIAFAILALAGLGCRYLSTAVIGNSDLYGAGKYLLIVACAGFVFEYIVSVIAP